MFLKSDRLQSRHGFSTRLAAEVTEFEGFPLVTAKQVHSDIAIIVNGKGDYQADALITDKPGVAIAVYTADCTPILLEDHKNGIVAAVHAGWRGARFGVIGSAIRAMQNMGATDISAVIGPCIHQNSYEVGPDFVSVFASETANNGKYFVRSVKDGHFMFDLPTYVEDKLKKNGVENYVNLNEDTLSQPEKFFSYRRGTISGVKETGRQFSVICL